MTGPSCTVAVMSFLPHGMRPAQFGSLPAWQANSYEAAGRVSRFDPDFDL